MAKWREDDPGPATAAVGLGAVAGEGNVSDDALPLSGLPAGGGADSPTVNGLWWMPAGVSSLDERAGILRGAPGPGLVTELVGLDVRVVDHHVLGDGIVGWERVMSWARARQNELILEQARRTEHLVVQITQAASDGSNDTHDQHDGHGGCGGCDGCDGHGGAGEHNGCDGHGGCGEHGGHSERNGCDGHSGRGECDCDKRSDDATPASAPGLNVSTARKGVAELLGFTGGACVGELSALLNLTSFEARKRLETAEMLDVFLDETSRALEFGTITGSKADLLAYRLKDVDPMIALTVEDSALPVGAVAPRAAMSHQIDAALILADPDGANKAHLRARKTRRVESPKPLPSGMASLKAVVPADHAKLIHSNLTTIARARKTEGDTRTLDQLRADTLLLLATDPGCCQAIRSENTSATTPTSDLGHGDNHVQAGTDDSASRARAGADDSASHVQAGTDDSASRARAGADDRASHVHTRSCYEVLVTIPIETMAAVLSGENMTGPSSGLDGSVNPDASRSPRAFPDDRRGTGDEHGAGAGPDVRTRVDTGVGDHRGAHSGVGSNEMKVPFLAGYGPITPLMAVMLAGNPVSRWRTAITGNDGEILSVSSRTYRPPPDLARIIRAREPHCVFPSCARPSQECDLDHTVPFNHANPDTGGGTCPGNLAPLCRFHHNLKTLGLWHLAQSAEGHYEWTSILGRTYTYTPVRAIRVTTVDDVFHPAAIPDWHSSGHAISQGTAEPIHGVFESAPIAESEYGEPPF